MFDPEGKNWCFTNYEIKENLGKMTLGSKKNPSRAHIEDVSWYKNDIISYIIVGNEVASKDQPNPHHQGYLQLKKKKRLSWIRKHLSKYAHWATQKARENSKASIYCSKEANMFCEIGEMINQGKRTDIEDDIKKIHNGTFDKCNSANYIKYHAGYDKVIKYLDDKKGKDEAIAFFNTKIIELYPHQKLWADILIEQNDRKLLWVWGDGNLGKTIFLKWLCYKWNGILLCNAASKDIAQAYNREKYVMFNFTRSTEEKLNYSVIEQLKDGFIFSPKYESGTKHFAPPSIIIVANFMPDLSAMSRDRWRILEYNKKKLIYDYDGDHDCEYLPKGWDSDNLISDSDDSEDYIDRNIKKNNKKKKPSMNKVLNS